MQLKTLRSLRVVGIMFHDVVDGPELSGFQRPGALPYKHSAVQFRQYINAIETAPVVPTTVDSIDPSTRGDRLLLTFDDGGHSAMRSAAILEEKGWKGHFFITTSLIDTKHFLSRADICDLHRRGHVIGSHSHTHPDIFYNLTDDQMFDEWNRSRNILSEIIAAPVASASIPGGDMDERVPIAAGKAGIRYLFTSEPTVKPWQRGEVLCFGRVCPRADTPAATVRDFVHFRGFKRAMAIRKAKQVAKRILASFYRRRMASAATKLPKQ